MNPKKLKRLRDTKRNAGRPRKPALPHGVTRKEFAADLRAILTIMQEHGYSEPPQP